jgi:hypothetical protein
VKKPFREINENNVLKSDRETAYARAIDDWEKICPFHLSKGCKQALINQLMKIRSTTSSTHPDCPNLDRTVKALKAYDAYKFDWDADNEGLLRQINEHDALAKAVGTAFGLDTADRNNMKDCEDHVRPGICPSTDSFIRRMVALWLQEKGQAI